MRKMYAVLLMPLFLSGCMMIGMGGMGGGGGMHGASHASSMNVPVVVRDSVVNGIRITAEFPQYAFGDELSYKVTLRDARDDSPMSDASIVLILSPDNDHNQSSRSGQAGSHSGHGDSATTQSQLRAEPTKVPPGEIVNGTYLFRPSIANRGVYKFVFVVERVGTVTMNPPIEVVQTVQLDGTRDQHSGNSMTGSGISPKVLIGAGLMAIMMIFMIR